MAIQDIRSQVPAQIASSLLPEERVYFYGTGKSCLAGSKSYVAVTESRVMGSAEQPGGCLGMKQAETVDIPLEHVSSVRTSSSGCLFWKTGTVVVSSGTANNVFSAGKPEDAQRAAAILQQAMREARKS
jgi:hypothetical protein